MDGTSVKAIFASSATVVHVFLLLCESKLAGRENREHGEGQCEDVSFSEVVHSQNLLKESNRARSASKYADKCRLNRLRKNPSGLSFRGAAALRTVRYRAQAVLSIAKEESRISMKMHRARSFASLRMTVGKPFYAACKARCASTLLTCYTRSRGGGFSGHCSVVEFERLRDPSPVEPHWPYLCRNCILISIAGMVKS